MVFFFLADDISVTKMYNCLVSHGGITFVDKVDHNKFIAICREPKVAKKVVLVKTMARTSCNVVCKFCLNDLR